MTKFGKSLVVLAVAASFAFLGVAWVSLKGGPNWDAEAATLPGYTVQKEGEGEAAKWVVTDRETGLPVSVPSPRVQAAAIVAARNDLRTKHETESAKLREETAEYKKKLAEVKKYNAADVKALQARVQELSGQLADLNAKTVALSLDFVKRSQEAQVIQREAAKRREDVYRLARELEEIRADNFRADELRKKLNDQLVRLDGVVAALKSRNNQLRGEAVPVRNP